MTDLTRREGLGMAALLAGGLAASSAAATDAPVRKFATKIDFKDPKWNRDSFARLDMDLNPNKVKIGWLRGTVYGVRENEPLRPLFINEGFSVVRCQPLPDGSYRRMLREVVFYRNLETGKIMDTWRNPYTNEDVRVVPVSNDPFNYVIGELEPEAPSYGGLNATKPVRKPFLLDWKEGPNDTIILYTGINLYYPSALQPTQWPRESAGVMSRVTELFTYTIPRKDLENPKLTHVPAVGAWSRVNPWIPWMLMGQAPGNTLFFDTFGTANSLNDLPKDIVDAARAIDPKFLTAPTEDYGPSLSSLENYAKTEKPAAVPPGWTPPMPPGPPPPRMMKPPIKAG